MGTRSSSSDPSRHSYTPAPYGEACDGCRRAKSKCYYRSRSSLCERCSRLSLECHSAPRHRRTRRKAPAAPPPPPHRPPPSPTPLPSSSSSPSSVRGLEERLDTLISVVQSQAAAAQAQSGTHVWHLPAAPGRTPDGGPPDAAPSPAREGAREGGSAAAPSRRAVLPRYGFGADIEIDPDARAVRFSNLAPHEDPVVYDVLAEASAYSIPAADSEARLAVFRHHFVPAFPFVHLPPDLAALELKHTRPLLWLVVMALTTPEVSQQLAMADTIWQVISRQVVYKHHANLDLLQGVICFCSWFQYFKEDKPLFLMLSQIAVSLAYDLNLHQDVSVILPRRNMAGHALAGQFGDDAHLPRPRQKTMEERRAMLAVAHMSSLVWILLRKIEPLRWSPYIESCARELSQGGGTLLDPLLAFQGRCHRIILQVAGPRADDPSDLWGGPAAPSGSLVSALMGQLYGLYHDLPAELQSHRTVKLYLQSTEVRLKVSALDKPMPPPPGGGTLPGDVTSIHRLRDLESLLSAVERWLETFEGLSPMDLFGMSADISLQWLTAATTSFRLNVLKQDGWDAELARQRVGMQRILGGAADRFDSLAGQLGVVHGPTDNQESRLTKMAKLLRALGPLFATGQPAAATPRGHASQRQDEASAGPESVAPDSHFTPDGWFASDPLLASMAEEPWIRDLFDTSWEL